MKSFLLFFFLSVVAVASDPIPIIIDTDIGDDFDDSWAITEAISRPDLWDIKMIVTAAKNTPARAQIVAKYLSTYKRTDIPIGIGLKTSNYIGNLYAWAKDFNMTQYNETYGNVHTDGVAAAAYLLRQQSIANPIRYIAIGPTTNFGVLVKHYQDVVPKVEGIYAMFGGLDYCYGHKPVKVPGSCSEYNEAENITSSFAEFNASWPITITPLDTCEHNMKGQPWENLKAANKSSRPFVNTLLTSYCVWKKYQDCDGHASDTLFDPTAMFMSRDLKLFNMQWDKLLLTPKGGLYRNKNGRGVNVALTWKPNGLNTYHQLLSQWILDYRIPE